LTTACVGVIVPPAEGFSGKMLHLPVKEPAIERKGFHLARFDPVPRKLQKQTQEKKPPEHF
jgi:hypothetical protein